MTSKPSARAIDSSTPLLCVPVELAK